MATSLFRRGKAGRFQPSDLIRKKLGSGAAPSIVAGFFEAPSGGGSPTTFYKSLTGLLTSSAVARKTSRNDPLYGSITPSGSLIERIKFGKLVSGSVTGSSGMRKLIRKRATGALTGLGSVRKLTRRAVAGSLTSVAVMARKTKRRVTAVVTPSGSYADALLFKKSQAGSLTMNGAALGLVTSFTPVGFVRAARGVYSMMGRR